VSRRGRGALRTALLVAALAPLPACSGGGDPEPSRPQATPSAASADQGPGPAVGETLPAFEAPDQTGRVWTFESLRGTKGLVLNVNRSVVW
jgi:hypothetical protein